MKNWSEFEFFFSVPVLLHAQIPFEPAKNGKGYWFIDS